MAMWIHHQEIPQQSSIITLPDLENTSASLTASETFSNSSILTVPRPPILSTGLTTTGNSKCFNKPGSSAEASAVTKQGELTPLSAKAFLIFDLYVAFKAVSYPVGLSEILNASKIHFKKWDEFYSKISNTAGISGIEEHETWRFLSWTHYHNALFFAKMGDRESAFKSIELIHKIGSATLEVNSLEDAIKKSDKALDITPFLLKNTKENTF